MKLRLKNIIYFGAALTILLSIVAFVLNRDYLLFYLKYGAHESFSTIKPAMLENLALIKRNSKNDSAYYSLGQGYFSIGAYDDAVEALESASALRPDADFYWAFLGKAYQAKREYLLARDAYLRAIEANPDRPAYYVTLAWLYYFRLYETEMQKAYEVLEQGLEKFPTDKDILFDITRYHLYDKNEGEFRKYAPRYLKIDPDNQLIKNAYENGIQ